MNKYRCKVNNIMIRRLFSETALKKGFKDALSDATLVKDTKFAPFFFVDLADKDFAFGILSDVVNGRNFKSISIGKMAELLSDIGEPIKFYDGNNRIVIHPNGDVSYGCTTVRSTIVNAIIKRRAKLIQK